MVTVPLAVSALRTVMLAPLTMSRSPLAAASSLRAFSRDRAANTQRAGTGRQADDLATAQAVRRLDGRPQRALIAGRGGIDVADAVADVGIDGIGGLGDGECGSQSIASRRAPEEQQRSRECCQNRQART